MIKKLATFIAIILCSTTCYADSVNDDKNFVVGEKRIDGGIIGGYVFIRTYCDDGYLFKAVNSSLVQVFKESYNDFGKPISSPVKCSKSGGIEW